MTGDATVADPPRSRRALLALAAALALLLLGGGVVTWRLVRRGPVDLAPLEAEAREARGLLSKSGRSPTAEAAARDTSERLRWAKAWNEALATSAPDDVRERAWAELERREEAAARSLPAARDEVRQLQGERW